MVDLSFPALTGFLIFLKDLIYIIYSFILLAIFILIQYGFFKLYQAMFKGVSKLVDKLKDFLDSDKNFVSKVMDKD